jgi:hypothetical protein
MISKEPRLRAWVFFWRAGKEELVLWYQLVSG